MDGRPTSFAGHNYSAFKGLSSLSLGRLIKVVDKTGKAYNYKVIDKFVSDGYGKDVAIGKDRYYEIIGAGKYSRGGEYIILQTCKTKTTNYIIKAVQVE